MQAYLEAYDFRGKKIEIMLVWADRLDEAENKIKFTIENEKYRKQIEEDIDTAISEILDNQSIEELNI